MRELIRIFRTQPGFAATVILVLALCMGANTALFTVVNALLLKPLPFPRSGELVEISYPGRRGAPPDVDRARSVEREGAFLGWSFSVAGAEGSHNVFGFRVTRGLMPLLEVRPELGRSLTDADFGGRAAMAGYEYWKSLAGGRDILGRNVAIEGDLYTIVGVLPADFYLGVRDARLIVANLDPGLASGGRRIARLRRGTAPEQARAELAALSPGSRVEVVPLARALQPGDARPVIFLQAAAGFVLLITCANLASLQLVRGLGRRRELAIRAAMGASRGRLARELASESAMLAAAGAALGLLFARALHDATLAVLPGNLLRRLAGAEALGLDARVAAFSAGTALAAILLFGLLPALATLRFDLAAGLRAAGRGAAGERRRFGQILTGLEIAMALMLLSCAGLTWKSLVRMENQYLGFRPEGVLRAMADFPASRNSPPERKAALYEEIERRVSALPGVAAAGIVAPQVFPFGGPAVRGGPLEIFGKPEAEARAEVYVANPGYAGAIGLPLLRGRWFNGADTLASEPVAVIGEAVARRYWGSRECLGDKIRLPAGGGWGPWVTILGVSGDVKNPVAENWQPTVYRPFAQAPSSGATLMVRTAGVEPLEIAAAVRREVRAAGPGAAELRLVDPLDASVRDYVSPQRFTARLSGVFAAIGLALAVAGVFGVTRYWVASRTAEIGIRLAIGAEPRGVVRLVLARAARTAGAGVAAGLAGAAVLRGPVAAQLVGVSALDPSVLGVASAAVSAAAVLAAWMPARRASRIDPAAALRSE